MSRSFALAALAAVVLLAQEPAAKGDPCGFVPPITIRSNIAANISRVGDQQTFVYFRNGIEDIVINPAFTGKISEFGMLVPFPTPPALRKAPDDIFTQLANAVDPPKVRIDVSVRWGNTIYAARAGKETDRASMISEELTYNTIRVLKEEAVGMYQAATLEAGSAEALKRWMTENQYVYPEGMDEAVNHYVKSRWCFVAIKARVGAVKEASPRPGMVNADNPLPADAVFTGALHATGFRFKTDHCVVPMRMGTYNEGKLFNRVYYLSDSPSYIEQLPRDMVKKQLAGKVLVSNVTSPLPVEIVGGTEKDVERVYGANWQQTFAGQRDPIPHNGKAKELFLTDLLASGLGRLSHTFEEEEKSLHLVAERMGLKGEAIDEFVYKAISDKRTQAVSGQISELEKLTLTVLEGDFPRDTLRHNDLTFGPHSVAYLQRQPAESIVLVPAPVAERPREVMNPYLLLAGITLVGLIFFKWRMGR